MVQYFTDNESDSENQSGSNSDSDSNSGSGSSSDSDGDSGESQRQSSDQGAQGQYSDQVAQGQYSDQAAQSVSGSDRNSSSGDEDQNHNTSLSSANSKSSHVATKSSRYEDKKCWDEDPDIYGIRRSSRDRKQPERIESPPKSLKHKRRISSQWQSSEEGSDGSDSEYEQQTRHPPAPKKPKRKLSSDYEDAFVRNVRGAGEKVSYKETSEEDEEDSEYVAVEASNQPKEDENTQTIDKILSSRVGKKGAVGMQTYIYEVESKGDPNSNFDINDASQTEHQFLVKWKGWAHIHNTWESIDSLRTQKVKGFKKLENFQAKEINNKIMRRSARYADDAGEEFNIEEEMEMILHKSYLTAERIFAEAEENSNVYFYTKWQNLPYSEATWELQELVSVRFKDELKDFRRREASTRYPKQVSASKHRPKFVPLKSQPDYVGGSDPDLILRDYQLNGLNWLIHAWCKSNSVILADEMGLGKTIQTISFLNYLFHEHQLYGPFLICLPLSTLNAWQREFARWAPDINVIVYMGDKDSRTIIHEYEWVHSSRRIKFNAILTTYEILLRDKDMLQDSCHWNCIMIDEAHRLKNEESQLYKALKEFKTNHRLLITGTPLQNSLKELWALLHFIMPDPFCDWETFERQHDGDRISEHTQQQKLHKQLEPYLLRRVKKDVEKSLPAKVEQILRIDMTSQQREYYKWILTKNFQMLRKGNKGSTTSFVNIMMELKKCCNHSFLTKPPEMYPTDPEEYLKMLRMGSGKLTLLDKLLVRLHETGHRVLIFSQMVRMLDILAEYLRYKRFPFQRLDGSVSGDNRRQALDHFNAEGSIDFCFLLSTRAGGLGINLATADTVIIFDSDWNPQNDLQAQARAHRIGQKKQVNIYRLVTQKSVEETIIERAKQKMVLDHLVIQSMDTSGRTVLNKKVTGSSSNMFNKDELDSILKFGAADLFKDETNGAEEPTCDIDEILRRAETRDEGPTSASDELLSAFKVASFKVDEEEPTKPLKTEDKDWTNIIPEDIRQKADDDLKRAEMSKLYLPPRKRSGISRTDDAPVSPIKKRKRSYSSDYSEPEKPKKRGRPRMHPKQVVDGFSDVEVRRFFKSFKKFSNPLRRLETIAIDAELRSKSLDDLQRLGEIIIARCKEEVREFDIMKASGKLEPAKDTPKQRNSRGPSFKLSGVAINARTTLTTIEELEPLDTIVPQTTVERASWVIPIKRVKDAHWDLPWSIQEDSRLLKGVYEYGMGSWDQIKCDVSLNLKDKILLDNPLKPQAKHLESRVQYLLKLVKSKRPVNIPKKVSKPKVRKEPQIISKAIIENDSSSNDSATRTSLISSTSRVSTKEIIKEDRSYPKDFKVKIKEPKPDPVEQAIDSPSSVAQEKRKKKKKKDKKDRHEKLPKEVEETRVEVNGAQPLIEIGTISFNKDHPYWSKVKKMMKPTKKSLKCFDSEDSNLSAAQQAVKTTECILEIGDFIKTILTEHEDPDFWRHYLWEFVSNFSRQNAATIIRSYDFFDNERKQGKPLEEEPMKKQKSKHRHKEHKSDRHRRDDESSSSRKQQNGHHSQSRHHRDHDRNDSDRHRDRDRGRESNYPKASEAPNEYQSPMNTVSREFTRESRYPEDFQQEASHSSRDKNYPQHGYSRQGDERRGSHRRNYSPNYRGGSNYQTSVANNRDSDRSHYGSSHKQERRSPLDNHSNDSRHSQNYSNS